MTTRRGDMLADDSMALAKACKAMAKSHKAGTWPKYETMRTELVQALGEVAFLLESGAKEMKKAKAKK